MKKLINLSALSFILLSGNTLAAEKNCLLIMVGGGKEWESKRDGVKTDISILVDRAAKAAARKTGCRVITGHNQTKEQFIEMIRKAGKPPFYKPGTTVHMNFTDHGTPQPADGNNGNLYIGKGNIIKHSELASLLKETFPKGQRLTFASSICWGSFTEMGTHYGLDSHFDYCGGTSTHPTEMSFNVKELRKEGGRIKFGPYVATALEMASARPGLTVSAFHKEARLYDTGNLYRKPGLLSSTSYARMILREKNIYPSVDDSPLEALINDQLPLERIDRMVKKFNLDALEDDLADIMRNGEKQCSLITDPDFHSFVVSFGSVYKNLLTAVAQNLPEPYKTNSLEAQRWLSLNKARLPELLANFYKAKMEFWAKNKIRAQDPKNSGALREEWKELALKLKSPLKQYLYHARTIQEGKTVADFLSVASNEQKARFNRYLSCESRPLI